MKRRFLTFGSMAILLLLAAVWWGSRILSPSAQSSSYQSDQTSNQTYHWQGNTYAPLPADREPGYAGSLPQWAEWRRRRKVDPKWEWKMPIRFYGKVVDQDSEPVSGVRIRYGWNSMNGSNERFGESDAQGMFSIKDIKGKILSIHIEKEGYHALNRGRASFEYAAFFDPHYIEPDPNNPVIFELLKKQEAQFLTKTEQEIRLPQVGTAAIVRLDDITLEVSLLANQIKPDQPWSMQLSATGAGIQTAADEFPVEAPTDGYQSSVTIDRQSPKPSGWRELYQGGVFYIKAKKGYGRIEVQMLAGDNKARVTTYLNPSGSRNLEFEPKK